MEVEKICQLAKDVIEIEASMIQSLSKRIDHQFAQACHYLYDIQGRIAVMGVGKSGHISRKIAATFASTGSPAFFIHPSEAKHGDMGMITKDDALLVLSNSGESEEILAILPFVKRLNIPLISLTGKPSSSLATAATINLNVSVEKEACPLGLAPTSSTTAALVMGDALAMALLEKRGFTEKDFALSHPGGTLGRRLLLKVDGIMHQQNIPIVSHDALLQEALLEMTTKKLGMTTVVNQQGELLGILTDGDIRRAFDQYTDIRKVQVHQIMSSQPKTITRHILAVEALRLLETHQITSLVVIEQSKPIGVVHIHDILRAGIV